MSVEFIIIYGDKSIFDSRAGELERNRDVQLIVQEHPDVGWHTMSGYDYYVLAEQNGAERWQGVDIFGLFDFLLETGLVMFGRTTTQSDFNDCFAIANSLLQNERQKKSGFLANERKPD